MLSFENMMAPLNSLYTQENGMFDEYIIKLLLSDISTIYTADFVPYCNQHSSLLTFVQRFGQQNFTCTCGLKRLVRSYSSITLTKVRYPFWVTDRSKSG